MVWGWFPYFPLFSYVGNRVHCGVAARQVTLVYRERREFPAKRLARQPQGLARKPSAAGGSFAAAVVVVVAEPGQSKAGMTGAGWI